MRAPSSTAWPTKWLISQEEMWGNLRCRMQYAKARTAAKTKGARICGRFRDCCRRTSASFRAIRSVVVVLGIGLVQVAVFVRHVMDCPLDVLAATLLLRKRLFLIILLTPRLLRFDTGLISVVSSAGSSGRDAAAPT
ncbi:hypothetical protein [Xanthomonas oryzae]|nr:hypothetical protein [Xanthomonas oryzae]